MLAVGLLVGAVVVWRLRRSSSAPSRQTPNEDLQLEASDLRERRNVLYERLESEGLDESERDRLERDAARVLKELDEVTASLPAEQREAASSPTTAPPNPYAGFVGFAFGAGLVGLFMLLFFWAQRDAAPTPEQPMAQSSPSAGAGPDLANTEPEIASRIQRIRAALDQNPGDVGIRKAYAESLLAAGLLYDAYTEAEIILDARPGDVDGLYFQGLVRLSMGQGDAALELLDQALTTAPDYVNARLVRGIAYLRMDRREDAIRDWEAGLQAADGQHPGLDQLLDMARSGMTAEEILGAGPGGSRSGPPAEEPVRTAEAPSPGVIGAAPGGPTYRLRLELQAGAVPPPGAVLFVSLRDPELPGPPAAVKRIDRPTFPIEIVLGSADSMLGRPLPESGTLSARLDADGSASTRGEADLAVTVEAAAGDELRLTLVSP